MDAIFSTLLFSLKAGRNNLLALVKELLLKKIVPHSLVEPLMKIHRTIQTNPQQQIQDIAEIISELRDPMKEMNTEQENDEEQAMEIAEEKGTSKAEKDRMLEGQHKKKLEIAQIKFQLIELKDDLDRAITDKDFVKAQDVQLKLDELDEKFQELNEELALLVVPRSAEKKTTTKARTEEVKNQQSQKKEEPETIHKCLVMLFELLQNPDINSLNATLQTILDEFVMASVGSLDLQIRNAALKALGALALRSVDMAKRHILLVLQMAHLDSVNVRMTALEVIFDLLMWYGPQSFMDDDSIASGRTLESVLDSQLSDVYAQVRQLLLSSTVVDVTFQGGNVNDLNIPGVHPVVAILGKLLDDRDLEIRTKVTEGLCKLMMSKVITSAKLFTRLILMWYNPVTEVSGKLRHILGAFFPLYASIHKENQVKWHVQCPSFRKIIFQCSGLH